MNVTTKFVLCMILLLQTHALVWFFPSSFPVQAPGFCVQIFALPFHTLKEKESIRNNVKTSHDFTLSALASFFQKPNIFIFNPLKCSLRAGSRWSTSEHGVAASAKSSGETARRESEPALISANILFLPRKPHKKIS